ncbi:TauD/TfdA family dioxygenase [Pseudorhodoferax sp. LjRoot39]|uniref:TauD/TfdA family dioxygenase n=1 Tax=Pseudorhodoferax sp. LjRoot39 TaxID=3342328 RepID=UPI003ECF222B
MNPKPYLHPSAWKSEDVSSNEHWIVTLDAQDINEIDKALAAVRSRSLEIPQLSKDDFVVPGVALKMREVLRQLEEGHGFALIRGLPIERYSKVDAARIYWGLGAHLGTAFAQNAQGDMLGHVRDLGADWKTEMKARGYQTRLHLPFHNDSTDVVGLLCLQKAKSGGASRIVSSASLHNEFVTKRPDLWEVMCQPFCVDRRGEESQGQKPYYVTPCFNYLDERLFVRYNRTFIESAQRFPEVAPLTAAQLEAMDLMDALCNDPVYYLDMSFELGDMQWLNNYVVLHSRGDYEDWPEPERKRHLLRLWLRTPGFGRLPAPFADRNSDMTAWQQRPRPPVFDASEIAAELAH